MENETMCTFVQTKLKHSQTKLHIYNTPFMIVHLKSRQKYSGRHTVENYFYYKVPLDIFENILYNYKKIIFLYITTYSVLHVTYRCTTRYKAVS